MSENLLFQGIPISVGVHYEWHYRLLAYPNMTQRLLQILCNSHFQAMPYCIIEKEQFCHQL